MLKFTGPKRVRNHQHWYYVLLVFISFFFFSWLSLLFFFSHNPYSHLNPKITITKQSKQQQQSCQGKYIYIHDIPEKFNSDMLKDCKSLSIWTDMCLFTSNSGLGPELDISNEEEDTLPSKTGWYGTNQFALDVIFHHRMKRYRCLTNDSSLATAIFVPFYTGLDISRYLWGYNTSVRDSASSELVRWLRSRPEWQRMGGRDHFVVAGRITWDFRRLKDEEPNWGNKFLLTPEAKNMTTLVVESSPWHSNDVGVPYPTYFHPSKVSEVRTWQEKMRGKRRKWLFSFAGAPRPNNTESIRGNIIDQCRSSSLCSLLDCDFGASRCHSPISVMRLFQSSIFCLQPQGDSYTRRSAFDAMVSGCIPVFFHPGSAYTQYIWHLPRDYSRYSVFISEEDVREGNEKTIEQVLAEIDEKRVVAMREEVIRMIPRLIYADPRSHHLLGFEDAVDVAVEGVIGIVEELRREIRGVKSREFREQNSWKYRLVGNEDPHEWDHFFFKPT